MTRLCDPPLAIEVELGPDGAPARFDVGLRFTELPEDAETQLARVLAAEE